jgi:hypothetical protein
MVSRSQLEVSVVGGVCRIKPINSQEIACSTHVVLSATLARALLKRYSFVFHIIVILGSCWRGFGGMGAVINATGLDCGCVNRARKFMPQAQAVFLESKRVKTHMTQGLISTARCEHARAIGFGEGRGPTWPLGTRHADCGVWNAWVCACANHTRHTRGTRRELVGRLVD